MMSGYSQIDSGVVMIFVMVDLGMILGAYRT